MAFKVSGTTIIDDSRNITGSSITAENFFDVPSGNTASRPASPSDGQMYFNTESNKYEVFYGFDWWIVNTFPEY